MNMEMSIKEQNARKPLSIVGYVTHRSLEAVPVIDLTVTNRVENI